MSRKYDSAAIDPKWKWARNRARSIATISYVSGFGDGTRGFKKVIQCLERQSFFAAFYKEAWAHALYTDEVTP